MSGALRFFFVLGQGRSGTAFLADLLDSDPRAVVRHEPSAWDPHILGLSRFGRSSRAVSALLEERFRQVVPDASGIEIYGEVNSYLRYDVDWLRRRFDPTLIHVVRDGRDFVRSAWIRDVQTPQQAQLPMVPDDDDPFAERWGAMDRFQRICWIWRHTNEMLAAQIDRRLRLEDLTSSYAAFREGLLGPTGVQVSEEQWRAAVQQPRNTSSQFRRSQWLRRLVRREPAPIEPLPAWRQWPEDLQDRFWDICGAMMERCGYRREI